MAVMALTRENFDEVIQSNEMVVVDFWAKWCSPCLAFAPLFEEVSTRHPDVIFAKVDIDEEANLAADFQVRSIPLIMIFRREFAVFSEPGAQTATSLHALVNDAKKIDLTHLREAVEGKQGEGEQKK